MGRIFFSAAASLLTMLLAGCGAKENVSSRLSLQEDGGTAKDLQLPGIRFCGVGESKVVDDAYEKFVIELSKKCVEQNQVLRNSKLPDCGGMCTVQFGIGDPLPLRSVQVVLNYNVHLSMPWISVTFGPPPMLPEQLLSRTLICEDPKLVAIEHYNIRQRFVDAVEGGLAYCTYQAK
jgi:hypothetical protein